MAWVFSHQTIDLYIKHYVNGTVTYIDADGQSYTPNPDSYSILASGSIINTDTSIEKAIIFAAISLFLVIMGGITSGLNVSLLSIDARKNDIILKLAQKNSSMYPADIVNKIKKIQPLISDRHLLLVTLLVANASCMEALPIFLDELVASWLAIVISVSFVLIFGEILPQALFTADPLSSGSRLYYIVLVMKYLFYPLCKPLAWLLDILLSKDHQKKGVVFTHSEINMIMDEIQQHPDERKVVEGALALSGFTVDDSLIPWDDVHCVNQSLKLDNKGLREIYSTGYSRIPVYEDKKDNIVGLLLVKTLILCDPDPQLELIKFLHNFKKVSFPCLVTVNTPLYECINTFQAKKTHFAMVCDSEKDEKEIRECWDNGKSIPAHIKWSGIITLEDIMEDIIQEEIADEFDIQSPLQAILEARQSKSVMVSRSKKLNVPMDDFKLEYSAGPVPFSQDASFVQSVEQRYLAKNKRTARASAKRKEIDNQQQNTKTANYKLATVPNSSSSGQYFDFHKTSSQSEPHLLREPFLSVQQKNKPVKSPVSVDGV